MEIYNDKQFIELRKVSAPGTPAYDYGIEKFSKYKEIANTFSKLSGDELSAAVKKYSDEELMRIYYCSKAFQDRVYKMFGYKNGDYIPDKDYAVIKATIANGINEAIAGRVLYWEGGEGSDVAGWHEKRRSYVYTAFIDEHAQKGCSLVAHEMAHSLYNTKDGLKPGFNSYYDAESIQKTYGKNAAPINLLGAEGDNCEHDYAGIEQGADSAALKVELTKLGIYNMFNSAPMTESQYKEALERFPENSLLKTIGEDMVKGAKIVGDIAHESPHVDMDVLREKASTLLAELMDGEEQYVSDRHGLSTSLAQSNFELEIQQEETVSRARGLV